MLSWCPNASLRFSLAAVLSLQTGIALGDAQYSGFDVSASALSDDNYGLSSFVKNDVTGSSLQLRGRYRYVTEQSSLVLSGRMVDENLDGEETDENDVMQLKVEGQHHSERSYVSGSLSTAQDTTQTDDALSSGFTPINVGRNRYSGSLSGEYALTETQSASLSGTVQALRFDEYSPTLSEYDYSALDVRYFWSMQETLRTYVSGVASRVEYNDDVRLDLILNGQFVSDRTDIQSVSLGLSWTMANVYTLDASFGHRKTKYQGDYYLFLFPTIYKLSSDEEGSGRISNLVLNHQGERSNSTIELYQEITPNTSGTLIDERRLEFRSKYLLTEKTSIDIRAFASEQRSELDGDTRDNIDVAYGSFGIAWKFRQSMRLRADYRYISRRYVNTDIDTESNRILVGFVWSPNRFEW